MKSKDKNNVQSEGMSFSIFFLSMSKAFAGVRVRGSVLQIISKDTRTISTVEKQIFRLTVEYNAKTSSQDKNNWKEKKKKE